MSSVVRAAAAESLPHLLECVQAKGTSHKACTHCVNNTIVGATAVQGMWRFISDKLLEAISIEPDPDILAVMMDSLCKVIILLDKVALLNLYSLVIAIYYELLVMV